MFLKAIIVAQRKSYNLCKECLKFLKEFFKRKLNKQRSVREYIIKNKINAYSRSYSGHFGFFIYFGLLVWIASYIVFSFLFILLYTTLPNDVPKMFWEPLVVAYVILSVVSLNLPYVITIFLIAYVIEGLIFCNEKLLS